MTSSPWDRGANGGPHRESILLSDPPCRSRIGYHLFHKFCPWLQIDSRAFPSCLMCSMGGPLVIMRIRICLFYTGGFLVHPNCSRALRLDGRVSARSAYAAAHSVAPPLPRAPTPFCGGLLLIVHPISSTSPHEWFKATCSSCRLARPSVSGGEASAGIDHVLL